MDPHLTRYHLANPEIIKGITSGKAAGVMELAQHSAAAALCDLGLTELACSNIQSGIKRLEEARNLAPTSQLAFHNLVAALLAHRLLRGNNHGSICQFLRAHWNEVSWARQYGRLLLLPSFLNIQFVGGQCNLRCRMCLGAHREGRAGRLEHLNIEDFRRMLQAAPTINGVTLSAGDSDPLLHPEFERIVEVAREFGVTLDMFTNGQALTEAKCRSILESKIVPMMNFSIDAATAETYRRIRGGSFERVMGHIERLVAMKQEMGLSEPRISMSFVAMADNIEELPAFVEMAVRLGALRVYVEDLIGWDDKPSDNHPATDHPRCVELLDEARAVAARHKLWFQLPQRLADLRREGSIAGETKPTLACCGWLNGVWVQMDGEMRPCCLVGHPADMGNIKDGPLQSNPKFLKVKSLLLSGKVFQQCLGHRMCAYVQQQKAAGIPLRTITREELGELWIEPDASAASEQTSDTADSASLAETTA